MANCKVIDFKFLDKPSIRERTPLKGMSQKELDSIKELPYVLTKNCHFSIITEVDKQEVEFRAVIPKGFCYNMANIIIVLEPVTYDKHSPFVKNASLVHDYLLDRRAELYNNWGMDKYGITPSNFRKITSDTFGCILVQDAVPEKKARIMAKAVDLFQAIHFIKWNNIKKVKKEVL